MPAEKHSFTDPLEPILYWDSNFTVAFFEETDPFHAECLAFCQRLEVEECLSTVSDLVYNELAFFLIKRALSFEGKRTGQHWLDVKRNNPNIIIGGSQSNR